MEDLPVQEYVADFTQFGLSIVIIFAIIFAAWVLAGIVRGFLKRRFAKKEFDQTLGDFVLGLIKPLFLIMGVMLALALYGVEPTSFAAVIGAAGLAIGLSLQGALGNVASGLLLLVFRPIKVGDVVEVGGEKGKVTHITLFTTELDTVQNVRVFVPNGVVVGNVIKNISHHEQRRVDVSVGTDYGADLNRVRQVLETVPGQVPNALTDPAPQVFLAALGGSSIDWQVRIWSRSDDYWQVFQDATRITKKVLDDAGIGIPFPQMDVHMDKLEV